METFEYEVVLASLDERSKFVCNGHTGAAGDRTDEFWPDNRGISHVECSYIRIVHDFRKVSDDKLIMKESNYQQNFFTQPQFVTLKRGHNIKYLPYAFTEQGVSMLSSVLNSERSIQVNIAIMRVFARIKDLLIRREDLAAKLAELEGRVDKHDDRILAIFDAIKQLIEPKRPRPRIGFIQRIYRKELPK